MNTGLVGNFSYNKLIKFTFPSMCTMLLISIYGVVDGTFVSNLVGTDAFVALNLSMPINMILGALGSMIGTGGSALVSKTLGEKDNKRANDYFSILILFLIIFGIFTTSIVYIFIPKIVFWLGAEGSVLEQAVIYSRVSLLAIVPFMLQNCFQSLLVVVGKQKMGLIISIFAGLSNVILDFVFMYIFKLGIAGAALATGASQVIAGVVPLMYFIFKKDGILKLKIVKLELKPILKACLNGSSEMLSISSLSIVNMLYNLQLMKYVGNNGVSAYGVIMYIAYIFYSLYIGFSLGVLPIIAYNYGSNNTNELKNLLKKGLKIILVSSIVITLISEFGANILAGIFVSDDKELLNMTIFAIRVYSISFLFNGSNIFISSFFTGLNNGVISGVISFLRSFVLQCIFIFVLPFFLGVNGIWITVIVSELIALFISIICIVLNNKKYNYY